MVPAVTFHCYVELCVMYGFVCVMYTLMWELMSNIRLTNWNCSLVVLLLPPDHVDNA